MMGDGHRYQGRLFMHELPTSLILELLDEGVTSEGASPEELYWVRLRLEIELVIRRLGLQ